jgi:hypothetical protein
MALDRSKIEQEVVFDDFLDKHNLSLDLQRLPRGHGNTITGGKWIAYVPHADLARDGSFVAPFGMGLTPEEASEKIAKAMSFERVRITDFNNPSKSKCVQVGRLVLKEKEA